VSADVQIDVIPVIPFQCSEGSAGDVVIDHIVIVWQGIEGQLRYLKASPCREDGGVVRWQGLGP
jgi:hypothetical protein